MPVRTRTNKTALFLFLIVIAGFFAAGFLVPEELPDGGKSPLPVFMFMMGGIFLLVNLVLLARAFVMNRRRIFIERNWITAQAEVLQVSETGSYINRQPRILFRLRVELPRGETREVEHRQVMPLIALQHFTVGKRVMVKIDPEDHEKIILL